VLIVFAALTIVAGCGLSLFASEYPDGLEWSIEKTTERIFGVETEIEAEGAIYEIAESVQERTVFLPDYTFESDPENAAGPSLSGIIGAAITFAIAGATGLIITKIKKRKRTEINA